MSCVLTHVALCHVSAPCGDFSALGHLVLRALGIFSLISPISGDILGCVCTWRDTGHRRQELSSGALNPGRIVLLGGCHFARARCSLSSELKKHLFQQTRSLWGGEAAAVARDISMELAGVWVLFSFWHRLGLSRCLVTIRREPSRCGAGWVEESGRIHCQT